MPLILRNDIITLEEIQSKRKEFFCFGDNVQRWGMGGMARICRGEPNIIGIVTKWAPDRAPNSYFDDATILAQVSLIEEDLIRVALLSIQEAVHYPIGIGSGLAEMPTRAPLTWAYLQTRINQIKEFSDIIERKKAVL